MAAANIKERRIVIEYLFCSSTEKKKSGQPKQSIMLNLVFGQRLHRFP